MPGEYSQKTSRVGTPVIVCQGYTYGLKGINRFRCTKHRTRKCLARAKLNYDGSLEMLGGHSHPPL